ncbi:MAG TPA: glycine reductase [Clostridiaceae bacterium]|nr:glycine reductase [Clostridiaceae bacterium]
MNKKDIQAQIADLFNEMATGLETGSFGKKPRIVVTGLGSEHGEDNVLAGCRAGAASGIDVIYLGTKSVEGVETIEVATDDEQFAVMEELLSTKQADGAVAMHYPFPIGVATVGRVLAPATGKPLYLATTTGTAATDRVDAMVKNAIAGVIAAKACGIAKPTVGILNIDGARQAEIVLNKLRDSGYSIEYATSGRADGGAVMRGNDVLRGTPDVMVMDSLTGNVLTKMMSAQSSGGSIETSGDGYGPGLGAGYKNLVLIVSRASGVPVIAGAIKFAAELVKGNVFGIADAEYEAAERAGLTQALEGRKKTPSAAAAEAEVKAPPKEVVTHELAGIEVMDLEDAVAALWKQNIYAESGMGCTGPIIRISEERADEAEAVLKNAGYR